MSEENNSPQEEAPKEEGKRKPGRKKGFKLTIPRAVWLNAERDWANGKFPSGEELCKHYGLEFKAFMRRMNQKGIENGQNIKDYNRKIQAELEEAAERKAKVIAERVEETREEHYRWASGIAKLTFAEVAQARQNQTPLGHIRPNLQSLETAMKVLKMAREERFAILGLNDQGEEEEDGLPELAIAELTPEEIEDLRSRGLPVEEEEGEIVSIGDIPEPAHSDDPDHDESAEG